MADDRFKYQTKWHIHSQEEERIYAIQEVKIEGFNESNKNQFVLTSLTPSSFGIELKNNIVGTVPGKGVLDAQVLAWEFHAPEMDFEGYEVYELHPDKSYSVRANYVSGEGLRTFIEGELLPVK